MNSAALTDNFIEECFNLFNLRIEQYVLNNVLFLSIILSLEACYHCKNTQIHEGEYSCKRNVCGFIKVGHLSPKFGFNSCNNEFNINYKLFIIGQTILVNFRSLFSSSIWSPTEIFLKEQLSDRRLRTLNTISFCFTFAYS